MCKRGAALFVSGASVLRNIPASRGEEGEVRADLTWMSTFTRGNFSLRSLISLSHHKTDLSLSFRLPLVLPVKS